MKTIVIWDDCQGNLKFFIVPYDARHLDGKYVNGDTSDAEADEINELSTTGAPEYRPRPMLEAFPTAALFESAEYIDDDGRIKHDSEKAAAVIVCGFIP